MRLRVLTLAVLALLVLASPAAACRGALTAGSVASEGRATLCLLNAERARHGLPPLRSERRLARAAGEHAHDMVLRGFFGHVSPEGVTLEQRLHRAGYLRRPLVYTVGETIAWGEGADATPAAIVDGWMRSPPHRATILRRGFRDVGLGLALGSPEGGDGTTVAANFGGRRR